MPESTLINLPFEHNSFFTGRDQALDALRRALTKTGKAALSGMGGIGKTQTAVEYAYRFRKQYGIVLWAKADSADALKTDLAMLAGKLDLPEKEQADKDVVAAAVKRWLEKSAHWLLILDNADDLSLVADLLRREWRGHLLLTTRAHATGAVARVDILEMTPEEGTLFLLRRAKLIGVEAELRSAPETQRAQAEAITREMDGLPLALNQAGAFIEEMQISLAKYLELYLREGKELRKTSSTLGSDHAPAAITFSLAFKQAAAANPAAADLLRAGAFLAPDAIPEEIFTKGAAELGESLGAVAGSQLELTKAIGEAGRFSLVRRGERQETIDIHRVVQQVLRDEMDDEAQRLWAGRVVRALNKAFPAIEYKYWPVCDRLLAHAKQAAKLIEEHRFEFEEAGRLLHLAGWYCRERAQYTEAEPLCRRSLSIYEQALGLDHASVGAPLNNLAELNYAQGKYTEAEPLVKRALRIYEQAFGPVHPDVATSLDNLAGLYYAQGKYTEAEPLYKRALRIREEALGREHPDVATCLNNLAVLYKSQGRYAEAEPLVKRALKIKEQVLGPEHPSVATSLNNLARLYYAQDKYREAEPLYQRALRIDEQAFGPVHPAVATDLKNLAELYYAQGKYTEAEPLVKRALRVREETLGREHPDVAAVLENYASLLRPMHRNGEAESMEIRAREIRKKRRELKTK